MSRNSPLRYPGGKQILTKVLAHLIRINDGEGGEYAEPYAGGAGAALALLFGEHVEHIHINDADHRIYAFWKSCLHQTRRFIDMVRNAPLTVEEWRRQREIYQKPNRHSMVKVGFSAFYLNRCNRSGIIATGGLIGGVQQTGRWKIDARFNREELERRIRKIAYYRDRISVTGMDALEFLQQLAPSEGNRMFVYLDPPYFNKGKNLYLSYYSDSDHALVARSMRRKRPYKWVMTYDNTPEISGLYRGFRQVPFDLDYSARARRQGKEIMISKKSLRFPPDWERMLPDKYLTSSDAVRIPHS